jgi:hypothetical protein
MKKILFQLGLCLITAGTALATAGGPDSYGYTFKDSNEPGGPVYNWIEIVPSLGGSGTLRTAVLCDDCHEGNIPLGFNFPYYGVNHNQISIGSNGTVYFENVYLGLSNSCMPGTPSYTMAQFNYIAHMWNDLAANYQGGIYTQAFPNYFVIEYHDIVPCCATGDGDTWQVILFKNGNILMQYKELSNTGLSGGFTTGIQNDATTGLQYICDGVGTALASGRAILFSPPTYTCPPVSQAILGPNSGYCSGNTVNLSAGAGSIAQMWSTGATTNSISVSTTGSYNLVALDTNGCSVVDTISIAEYSVPVVNLGSDVTLCGGAAMLDAGNPGSSYLWSNGATSQMINANSSGTYSVQVTNINGCTGTDAASVTIYPVPMINLGSDINICGGSIVLDAGISGASYSWNTGASTQTISVSSSGTYSVSVTDANGCSGNDAINIGVFTPPVVDLGADLIVCGTNAVLDAANSGATYNWSTGETTQTITVSASGSYNVMITDANGCTDSDVIDVSIYPVPVVTLSLAVDTMCTADAAIALTGGSPAGGTYAGPGVTAGIFDPSVAGTGVHTISYMYTDANGCADATVETITVDVCAGITESSEAQVAVYPNPSAGVFNVTFQGTDNTVEVYNSTGKLVYFEQINASTGVISLEGMSNGIYLMKVNSAGKTSHSRILIQK